MPFVRRKSYFEGQSEGELGRVQKTLELSTSMCRWDRVLCKGQQLHVYTQENAQTQTHTHPNTHPHTPMQTHTPRQTPKHSNTNTQTASRWKKELPTDIRTAETLYTSSEVGWKGIGSDGILAHDSLFFIHDCNLHVHTHVMAKRRL